jgi:glutathione S-transferase
MIVLHHCIAARSFRALWTLEELQLPYQLRVLPFPPRVAQRSYLVTNPLGTVPLLEDGAVRMTESAAICQYLVDSHSPNALQVTPTDAHYGAYLNWLHFGEATLTFPQTLVLRYRQMEPPERQQPQVVTDYSRWFLARLRGLEAPLALSQWLCGERFTAADVSVGYALLLAEHLGLSAQFSPAVAAYWARLQQRPAYLRALVAEQSAAAAQGVSGAAAAKPLPTGL